MKLNFAQFIPMLVGVAAYFGVLYFLDRAMPRRYQAWYRWAAALGTIGILFYALQEWLPIQHKRGVEVSKAVIAIVAAAFVFYEQHRKAQARPIAERWKKLVGIVLAMAAVTVYFDGFRFGYPPYYHRWDQYHYYMGAKYFPELGYKNLYRCAVVALDELGTVQYTLDRPHGGEYAPARSSDFREEMRDPDKKIRDLPGENLLLPVTDLLDHPEQCRDRFTPERWDHYKKDVAFFRIVSGKEWFADMQKDHGFNPPPVWTIAGKFFSDLTGDANVLYMQFLASLDILYLIGAFVALWWGFGWRVFAVAAIFWGCQSAAPFYWTGGAFLRQDWLFFTSLSVACLRKRYFGWAGASVVYAAMLRIFPGLVIIGTLVPFVTHIVKHRRVHRDHLRMLIGGTIAALVLVPLSIVMTRQDPGEPWYQPYKIFYEHTIETHDKTPLTNHMGLRVIIGHKFFDFQKPGLRSAEEAAKVAGEGASSAKVAMARVKWPIYLSSGPQSGQMEYVRDNRLLDPFEDWKRLRNERYDKYKPIAYVVLLASLAAFAWVVHRIKSLWVAQCLGQIFIILLSQLTCYYYSFMILAAPLIRLRRGIELGLFALAAVTQIIWMNSVYNDNKYTLLTIVSLAFCYFMLGLFWRIKPKPDEEAAPAKVAEDDEEAEQDEEDDEQDVRAPKPA